MTKPHIEKDWVTSEGIRAAVLKMGSPFDHRCGYVGVPDSHVLYGIGYQELEDKIIVHGGLTFSGELSLDYSLHWFGYDCAHSSDKSYVNPNGIERSLEYCIQECEELSKQLCKQSSLLLFYSWRRFGSISKEQHNLMLAYAIEDPKDRFVVDYFKNQI